jgi:hypothetical protein
VGGGWVGIVVTDELEHALTESAMHNAKILRIITLRMSFDKLGVTGVTATPW